MRMEMNGSNCGRDLLSRVMIKDVAMARTAQIANAPSEYSINGALRLCRLGWINQEYASQPKNAKKIVARGQTTIQIGKVLGLFS